MTIVVGMPTMTSMYGPSWGADVSTVRDASQIQKSGAPSHMAMLPIAIRAIRPNAAKRTETGRSIAEDGRARGARIGRAAAAALPGLALPAVWAGDRGRDESREDVPAGAVVARVV